MARGSPRRERWRATAVLGRTTCSCPTSASTGRSRLGAEGPPSASGGRATCENAGVLILLSPAKSLDYESRVPTRKHTEPRMLDQSSALIDVLRTKTVGEVADMMSISLELADLNVRRYADFSPPFTMRNARQAAFAFDGAVYRGMDSRGSMDGRDLAEAQKTVRILSGLYGVLRPLDLIQPYRLEMGTRLRTERGETLYQWWGPRITDVLNADLTESPGPSVVVNLASGEYFRSVDTDQLQGTLISPRFL